MELDWDQAMKDETLEKADKAVKAASLLLLNEASLARQESALLVLEVDPDWHKLEAFAIGFLCEIGEASGLPKENTILRFVSCLRFLNAGRKDDPLVALHRALKCEFDSHYAGYFGRGKQRAARILAGDYAAGLYIEALHEESRASKKH